MNFYNGVWRSGLQTEENPTSNENLRVSILPYQIETFILDDGKLGTWSQS